MFDDSCNIVQENETDIWRKTNHLVTKKKIFSSSFYSKIKI